MFGFEDRLESISRAGAYRRVRRADVSGARIEEDGRRLVDFSSNDYLGISGRIDWQREFLKGLSGSEKYLMGSLSSRLLGCNSSAFDDFEKTVSAEYSRAWNAEKSCLLFNCGYHANSGIIPALATSRDLVLADKLSHASLIDALKLTDAKWLRFPHNDLDRLEEILRRRRAEFENVYIVTESVFSMDGDFCDLRRLSEIRREFGAFLYVDEAHAFGLYGAGGLGRSVGFDVDLAMCTLGKAASSEGAFVLCSAETREMLVNRCRTFIYSTALSPVSARWSRFVFEKILGMDAEREHLRKISAAFRSAVSGVLGESQIAPVSTAGRAIEISAAMESRGFRVPAIRKPTVPTERLRFSFSAAHSESDVLAAAKALGELS